MYRLKNEIRQAYDALLTHINKYGSTIKLEREAMISDLANDEYVVRLQLLDEVRRLEGLKRGA